MHNTKRQNSKTPSSNSQVTDCDAQELPEQETSPLLDSNKSLNSEGLNLNSQGPQKRGPSVRHHRLCDKSSPGFQLDKCNSSAKNKTSSESVRGPRYCSVRVQSGSKNILLDNVHNNIAPVLYTHPTDKKSKKDDHNSKILNGVMKIHDLKSISNIKPYNSSQTQSYSSEERKSINLVDESIQNQQRVAEWIQSNQNNLGNDEGSSDNSRSDSLKRNEPLKSIDPARYAEMENNVKKFLFGESQSEFLKKVAIGKQNYQNLRDYNSCINGDKMQVSRSNSHTETEI